MPSSDPSQTHHQSPQNDPTHQPESQQDPSDPIFLKTQESIEIEGKEEEEEEEGECGFCLFMKAGGCRETFIDWEKCVDEGEKNKEDIVDKCHSVTKALKECMEAHPEHYGPILQAEKAAEAEAKKELEKEKEEVVATIEVENEKEGGVVEPIEVEKVAV